MDNGFLVFLSFLHLKAAMFLGFANPTSRIKIKIKASDQNNGKCDVIFVNTDGFFGKKKAIFLSRVKQ